MIRESKVREFFNEYAGKWDSYSVNTEAIAAIFNNLEINENSTVLDVGCGTGVLVPFYLEKNIHHLDAIDISDRMIEICRRKFDDPRINFICQNVMELETEEQYDLIMIYNAFPHLPDHDRLFKHLTDLLKDNGQLVIAHGLSLAHLMEVHEGVPSDVAIPFPDLDTLRKELSEYLTVTEIVDNDDMFYMKAIKQNH